MCYFPSTCEIPSVSLTWKWIKTFIYEHNGAMHFYVFIGVVPHRSEPQHVGSAELQSPLGPWETRGPLPTMFLYDLYSGFGGSNVDL